MWSFTSISKDMLSMPSAELLASQRAREAECERELRQLRERDAALEAAAGHESSGSEGEAALAAAVGALLVQVCTAVCAGVIEEESELVAAAVWLCAVLAAVRSSAGPVCPPAEGQNYAVDTIMERQHGTPCVGDAVTTKEQKCSPHSWGTDNGPRPRRVRRALQRLLHGASEDIVDNVLDVILDVVQSASQRLHLSAAVAPWLSAGAGRLHAGLLAAAWAGHTGGHSAPHRQPARGALPVRVGPAGRATRAYLCRKGRRARVLAATRGPATPGYTAEGSTRRSAGGRRWAGHTWQPLPAGPCLCEWAQSGRATRAYLWGRAARGAAGGRVGQATHGSPTAGSPACAQCCPAGRRSHRVVNLEMLGYSDSTRGFDRRAVECGRATPAAPPAGPCLCEWAPAGNAQKTHVSSINVGEGARGAAGGRVGSSATPAASPRGSSACAIWAQRARHT
ncbi:hypothetical protein ACJJTC_015193 [Scirpophaga incertulas]